MNPIAELVTATRVERKLTQEQAADKWHIGRSTLSMIEAGHSLQLQPKTLLALSAALGIDAAELLRMIQAQASVPSPA
jgi:transcriptional regulator with XRE-family HTH domain